MEGAGAGADGVGAGCCGACGGLLQPEPSTKAEANRPTPPRAWVARHNAPMWLLVIEALLALAILIFIVWWTMFSGRRKGELQHNSPPQEPRPKPDQPPP